MIRPLALALSLLPAWPGAAAAEMLTIPEGTLRMGSMSGEPAERPLHAVFVSRFEIDRYEVTNAEFAEFVAATGYVTDVERSGRGWDWETRWRQVQAVDWRHPHGPRSSIDGLGRHPVAQVSWNDASRYCRWRGKRLPTEAEWERAARGDGDRRYAWGNQPPLEDGRYRASYGAETCCHADDGDGYRYSAPVGSFALGRATSGADDLTGNVWEWTQDSFDPEFYENSPARDPVNRAHTGRKVIRGGGWGNNPWGLRATLRHANPPAIGLSMVGFRCAR